MASPASVDASPASTIASHDTGESTNAMMPAPTSASVVTYAPTTVLPVTSPRPTSRTATPPIARPFESGPSATLCEDYDGHEHVYVFDSIQHHHVWYTITVVRVKFVYKDIHNHNLQLFLLDKNRDTIAAVVPQNLIPRYEHLDLVGRVFSIHHFQMDGRGNDDFPRHGSYSLHRNDWEIVFNKNTNVTSLTDAISNAFPFYPKMASLKTLADDVTLRKMIVDVVGIVTEGRLIRYTHPYFACRVGYCELSLRDSTGQVMKLILHHTRDTLPGMLAQAKRDKMIVFVSRVKLIHRKPGAIYTTI